MSYAAETSVSVEKTRAELETLLRRYRSDAFGYMSDAKGAMVQFRCKNVTVRFHLPLPDPREQRFWKTPSKGYARTNDEAAREWEQACRSAWRALLLVVKAKLEAVELKITTFEEEFLAHVVLPNGTTVGAMIIPAVAESYSTGKMPSFALALPEA